MTHAPAPWAGLVLALAALAPWAPAAHAAGPTAAGQVTAVYQQIAWQAVLESGGSGTGLLELPADRLARHFDPALAGLISRHQRCQARAQGDCALDFDPFWDSQDPVGTTVAVAPGARDDEVTVKLRNPGGKPRSLTYRLVRAAGGWRIADIRFGGQRPSLKALLEKSP